MTDQSPFERLTERMAAVGYTPVTVKGAPAFRDDPLATCARCHSRGLSHRLFRKAGGNPPFRLFSVCRHCDAMEEVPDI